jgi:Icc protein
MPASGPTAEDGLALPSRTPTASMHSASTSPVRLLQLTDLHLHAEPEGRLLGQNTARTFELVAALAQTHDWPPDALLLTGDLAHDGSIAPYRYLRERLEQLGRPFHCIPGNHDHPALLAAHLQPRAAEPLRIVALGPWDLALLDSTIPGSDGGHLSSDLIAGLARHLDTRPERPTLVALHHQPVPMGSRWMDTMMVDNGERLIALTAQHENLRGIVWGHVHQAFSGHRGNALLLAAPSTCIQFLPGSDDFALDRCPPGYRRLDLYPDGSIETLIRRIDGYPEPLLDASTGY